MKVIMSLGPANDAPEVILELLAIAQSEYEIKSRSKPSKLDPPFHALGGDKALSFYFGINHDVSVPETTIDYVLDNLNEYNSGVLARELVDLYSAEEKDSKGRACTCSSSKC